MLIIMAESLQKPKFQVFIPLCLKAAGVVQLVAREEIPEGPGSRHLTGPAPHSAHCHQRSTLTCVFSLYSVFLLNVF